MVEDNNQTESTDYEVMVAAMLTAIDGKPADSYQTCQIVGKKAVTVYWNESPEEISTVMAKKAYDNGWIFSIIRPEKWRFEKID